MTFSFTGRLDPELNLRDALRGLGDHADKPTVILDEEALRVLAMAPNAIEWCTGRQWVNSPSLFEFYRSYQTIRDYFELRCPNCNEGGTEAGQPGDCWNKSRAYLESEVLLVWDRDNLEDTCPKCGDTRSQFIEDGLFAGYNQMHLVVGMRAGKSMTAALIGTYAEHIFLSLGHTQPGGIHKYLGITPAEQFEIAFLASNQVQSEGTVWAKYTGFRGLSPWFTKYTAWIEAEEKKQLKSKKRRWTYTEGVKEIANEHPNIRLIINALNSNSAGQAGRTRVHGFVDELDRMNLTESRLGAHEIYRTIENSLRTIRSRVKLYGGLPWFGSMVSVTSPKLRSGKAFQLLQIAPEIPDMYARHYPTWGFNPKEPRENFESDFKKDPIGAMTDFGAQPPGAEFPLIHDEQRWLSLTLKKDLVPRASFEYFRRKNALGQSYVGVRLKKCERLFDRRMPRFVVFDAGKNFDAFAGVAAHGRWQQLPDGTSRLLTVYDWAVRIVAGVGEEIWFESVFELMKELRQYQATAFCAFDHWNSVQLIQKIRDLGIPAEQESLSNQDFIDFKVNCFEGIVQMIPPNVIDLKCGPDGVWEYPLIWLRSQAIMQAESCMVAELLELQCDPDTQKVSNPQKGDERGVHSDDLARVAVHAHKLVQRAQFTERYDDRSRRAARKRAEHGSVTWGNNRGGLARLSPTVRNWSKGRGW